MSFGSTPGGAWNPRANSVFLSARELPAGPQRDEYVRDVCGADEALRGEVDALLAAEHGHGDFLEGSLRRSCHESSASAHLEIGALIGSYKLLETLGEGGMGVVYLAEQFAPLRRRVALKIIKPGMDSRHVAARFDAERQSLALMDHPNIAKVLDAGTTDAGQPYFVMELVSGLPITTYCHEQNLPLAEQFKLFVSVCQAVQHAHQKGVIHRDLKPSNVLIALYDGVPTAKVIDFGVAKAIDHRLTDHSLATMCGAVVGTLEYMSPEQADLNQLDVDTRSDVYSLGVVLYELITGMTPLAAKRQESSSFDELRRIIREEMPPRPSALTAGRAARAGDASKRSATTTHGASARSDLDWIVMKALEKDRNRRYETAEALGRDVERYLAKEPIEARPPSAIYRIRMIAYRHRGPAAAALLFVAAVLVGACVSTALAIRARRAEVLAVNNADAAKRSAEAERRAKLDQADQRDLADERLKFLLFSTGLSNVKFEPAEMSQVIDRISSGLDEWLLGDEETKAAFLLHMARICSTMNMHDEVVRNLRAVIARSRNPHMLIESKEILADSLRRLGEIDEATDILQESFGDLLHRVSVPGADELRAAWPARAQAGPLPTDRPGQDGLELDGTDDFVVLPSLQFDGRPPWTWEIILNPADINQTRIRSSSAWTSLISTADGGGVGLETKQRTWSVSLSCDPVNDPTRDYADATAQEEVILHQWQHIAGVWDGAELRLYLDGRLAATEKNATSCFRLSKWPFYIGADPCDPWFGSLAEGLFQGRIRAARISRGVEYKEDFSPPHRLDRSPDTVGLYDFTIDTGRYAIDRSGRGHHGIIVGAKFVAAAK